MSDFFNSLNARFHIDLNEQQKAAVSHGSGPALILAGPGSGKTTVITARTAYLILESGISPGQILTLTFNKAAQLEMKNRFYGVFGRSVSTGAYFTTLHSFCYSVIKEYEKRKGKRLKLIEGGTDSNDNKHHILKELYKELNSTSINEEELETLINDIGFVKNKMIKEFEDINLQTRNFEKIFKAYEHYKKSKLFMDFDDMLVYCHSILRCYPDILESYKNRYTYFQVDEGQDLSKIQLEILKLLVASEKNNLFLVADDDQSIYGFRGAEPGQILNMESHFNDISFFKLEKNYRSSKDIVNISSQFIKSNKERYDKSHETDNPEMFLPQLIRVKDEQDQLSFVENKIKEHLSEKSSCKIAVLYRNNLSSIAFVDKFEKKAINYKLKQNRLYFFEHWMVQDILSFFKFSLDPFDKESFSRIYFKMNRYISRAMMETVLNSGLQLPVLECIIKSCDLKPFQINKIRDLIKEFKGMSKMSPYKALMTIEDRFKYFGSVKDYCEHTGLSFDYLYSLFGILKTLSQTIKTLPAFLVRLEELKSRFEGLKSFREDDEDDGNNRTPVTLTTFHSAKGLEYDTVFMVDLANREIPGERALSASSKDHDESLIEEERRLFYVGMTRAKTRLYLVFPETLNDQRESRSVFVNEVAAVLNGELKGEMGEGVIINHKKYGRGVIAGVKKTSARTMIEVDFKGSVRTFDLKVCIDNGIISLEA